MKSFWLWDAPAKEEQRALAILFLRLFIGAVMLTHGFYKLANFATLSTNFPNPIGIGIMPSLAVSTFAEVVGSLLLLLGVLTRPAALMLVVNMIVAGFFAKLGAPFADNELAMMYLAIYIVLVVFGGGKYSLDWILFTSKQDPKARSRKNMSAFDRIVRMLISLIIWYFVLSSIITGVIAVILILITVPLMVTCFWGYCPAYNLFRK